MALELYAFEMLTGRRLTPLPVSSGSWALKVNADETIDCSIKSNSAAARELDVWGSTVLARNGLLAVVDGEPVAAGPLWKRSYSQGGDISLTAGGLRSYWERRLLLPPAARTTPFINPATGDPDTSLDTVLSGLSYGTIAKRWVELMLLWPGGAIPMSLPPDEAGTRVREVKAVELKNLRKLLDDLSGVINGPEIAFRPRWSADGLGIYWEMQTGTNARPQLGNPDPTLTRWTVGAPKGGAFDLSVEEDATSMSEEVFASGGRQSDSVLISRARSTVLPNAGFPLLQSTDTSHNDVVEVETLNDYAEGGADLGRYVASFWSMSVRAHEPGTPRLGDYWLGDMATIDIDKSEPVLGKLGSVERRIAAISGSLANDAYSLTFAEALA